MEGSEGERVGIDGNSPPWLTGHSRRRPSETSRPGCEHPLRNIAAISVLLPAEQHKSENANCLQHAATKPREGAVHERGVTDDIAVNQRMYLVSLVACVVHRRYVALAGRGCVWSQVDPLTMFSQGGASQAVSAVSATRRNVLCWRTSSFSAACCRPMPHSSARLCLHRKVRECGVV